MVNNQPNKYRQKQLLQKKRKKIKRRRRTIICTFLLLCGLLGGLVGNLYCNYVSKQTASNTPVVQTQQNTPITQIPATSATSANLGKHTTSDTSNSAKQ